MWLSGIDGDDLARFKAEQDEEDDGDYVLVDEEEEHEEDEEEEEFDYGHDSADDED